MAAINIMESIYLACSGILVTAGFLIIGMSVRAYAQTDNRAMIHLSVGFALIVAASLATVISALTTDFRGVRSLLLVNTGFSSFGYVFVVYSLVVYE